MKVAFWGKGNDSLNKAIEKVLTAEDAQKISDAALEVKCARWIDMITKHALYTIKGFAEEGRYYVKYQMYSTGEIAKEDTQGWTSKMHNRVSETVKERLAVYANQTAPLIDYYKKQGKLISVDGDKSITEVFDEIVKVLSK